MMYLTLQFFLALFSTLGFCIIFRVPVKIIPPCVLIGAFGWIAYQIVVFYNNSAFIACFAASCLVGLLSEIAARIFKDATTIFVIPGILCLVPGSNIFKTMVALLDSDIKDTASIGLQTLMMAGAIAAGLLFMGAVSKTIFAIVKKPFRRQEH